jgi:hypothetical protein
MIRSNNLAGTSENSFSMAVELMAVKVCNQLKNALWVINCRDTFGIEVALNST